MKGIPLPESGDTICGDLRLEALAPVSLGAKALRPVWIARPADGGETIWLTLVDSAYAPTSIDISRFMAGANALLTLRHPSLARVVRVDREADDCVVGYEALPGAEPLSATVARPDARRQLTRTALELARGLAFLHRNRIVHGAMSPTTVLMWEGVPLLWQHGIASLCVPDVYGPKAAARGDLVAPEVASGEPVSTRSDVYAWGAVVATLASGTVGPEAIERVLGGKIGSSVHAGVLALVSRALQPSPAARPHDGIELLDALLRALGPAESEAGAAPVWVPPDSSADAALRKLATRYLEEIAEGDGDPIPRREVQGDATPRDGVPVDEAIEIEAPPPPVRNAPPPPPAAAKPERPSSPPPLRARGSRGKAYTPLPPLPELPRVRREEEPALDRVLEELAGPDPREALDLSAYEAPLPPPKAGADEDPAPPPPSKKRRVATGPSEKVAAAPVPGFVPPRLPGPHGPRPRSMALGVAALSGVIALLSTLVARDHAAAMFGDVETWARELAPQPAPPTSDGADSRDTDRTTAGEDARRDGPLVKAGECPKGTVRLSTPPEEALSEVCIDDAEYPGWMEVPTTDVAFVEAQKLCADRGRRLCSKAEWRRACQGVEKRPLPYGLAPARGRCRTDADPEVDPEARAGQSGARPKCKTPEGVFDMVGNVAEWVAEGSALGGGFSTRSATCSTEVKPPKKAGRPDIGFRCCVDVGDRSR